VAVPPTISTQATYQSSILGIMHVRGGRRIPDGTSVESLPRQMRVTRVVGAFAAGRIINPRLVKSQYYGGMIWGVSFALHEQAIMDPRSGRLMNANLAEYHVPVNADVPSLEAILVEEHDERLSHRKSRVGN
jgi:CO/xanthine dehydrogenase Mo-binding subunit